MSGKLKFAFTNEINSRFQCSSISSTINSSISLQSPWRANLHCDASLNFSMYSVFPACAAAVFAFGIIFFACCGTRNCQDQRCECEMWITLSCSWLWLELSSLWAHQSITEKGSEVCRSKCERQTDCPRLERHNKWALICESFGINRRSKLVNSRLLVTGPTLHCPLMEERMRSVGKVWLVWGARSGAVAGCWQGSRNRLHKDNWLKNHQACGSARQAAKIDDTSRYARAWAGLRFPWSNWLPLPLPACVWL